MRKKKAKKVITIMLVLAMVFALMPQLPGTDSTAFATPTSGLFLSTSNMSGDGYKYNGSTHVLELNGYTGTANNLYFTGVSETKNQIILSGSNSINLTSQTGTGNIEGIYSGSELRIAGDGSLLIQINANMLYNQGLTGIFANKKLTITESAQVTIIINSTSVDKGNTTYGIKAMGGISVESGASLDIRIEDCGKSYPVYGIYNYGGEIHISGNQKKSIEITGGSTGYGIYNYSYSTAEGNGNIKISGGSNAEASVDITMHGGADNFHVGIMSDKGSNKLNNTTGVISISSKTVNISGTERGIVNASAARNTADIAINDSKLTINGTENGIISYQNGASFDNSVVNITASGIAADFSNYDGFKNRSDYGLCISGGSKVNLKSASTTAVRTYMTSGAGAVSTIDLKNGGYVTVTAANNDAGNNMNAWIGFVKLGSTTDFEKGNWGGDSHSLDSDARGCVSIPFESTTILKLKYSPAYPEGSDIQVNNGTFSFGGSAYYKNGDTAESHTGSSTDYNAYYNSETGVLELKDYEGGYINISSATPREITIRLTVENTITADTIFGGSGNRYYGINMRDMKKINFTGDGTLNVNVNAPGSSAAAGIFIGKSGASVTNAQLNFKDTAKVKIDVSEKNDGSSNSYNVSAIDASAMANGFAVTVDEGADLDMNITSPYATTYGIYLPTDEKAAAAINGGFHLKMKCNGTSGSATSFKSFSTSKGTFTIGEKASVSVEMPSGVNHDMENFKVEAAGSNLVSSLLSGSYAVASYETEDFRMIKSDPDAGYLRYGSFDYMSKAGATGVSGVSVTPNKMALSNGGTAEASATVSPAAATYPGVTWSSGNKDLAAVDKDGKITAASSGSGKVAITATSKFNRLKSGSTAVTVGTLDDNKIYEITGITVAQPVVGAKPATAESVTVAEGFTISAVSWSYSPDGGKSWAKLSSSDVFEAGKEYRVKLDISKTTEGKTYAAKGQTVAWVNGEAVQAGDIKSDGTIAYFTYHLGQASASITKQPESQTVSCYTSEPVTLSCEVTLPEGQTAEYQWYVYYNNAWMPAWIAGDGDESSTLTITNRSFESLQFYCKITVKEGDTEVETLETNSARIKLVHSENDVSYNNTGSSSKHKKNCGYCGGSLDEAHTIINIVTREATSSLEGTYNKVCTKCGYTSKGHTYAYVNGGTVAIYLEGLPGGTQKRTVKALKSGTVEDTSNPPTKAGYTFLGWSLTEGASIPDINAGQSILFTGDTAYYEKNHFYAVWELYASGETTSLDVKNGNNNGTNWYWYVDDYKRTANLTLYNYSGGGFSIDGMDENGNKYDITVIMIGNNEMAVTKDSTGWLYGIKVLTVSGNTESTANSLTFKDGGDGTGTLSIRGRLSESRTQYAVQAETIPSLTVESGTLNIDMGAMIGSQTLYGIYCSGYGDNSSTDGMFTLGENAVLNISGDMAGWSGGKFYGIRTNNGDIYGKLNIEAEGTKSFIAEGIDATNGASRIVNFNGKEDVIISLPQSGNSRAVAANTVNYLYQGDNWTTAVEAPEGGKVNGNHYYIGDETGSLKFTDIETYYYGENITVVKNHYYGGSVSEYSSLRYHYFETPCTGADDVKHKDTDGNYECDNCHQRLVMGNQPAQTGTVAPGNGASATVNWTLQSIYDSEQINALQTSPQIYFKVKRNGQWSGSWISIDSLGGYTDPDLTAAVGSDGRSITFTQEEGSEKAQQYELKLQLKYWFENDPTCFVKTETLPFLVTFGNTVDVNLSGIITPIQGETAAQDINSIVDATTGAKPTGFTVTDVNYFDNVSNSWITNDTFEAGQNVTIYITCRVPAGTTLKKENVTLNGKTNEEDIYIDSNVTEITQDDGSTAYGYRIIWNYGEPKPETPLPAFESYQQSELPNGSVDELYLYTFSYTGSDEGLKFSISDGNLPDGIKLNEDGMLTGSPEVGGTFTFKVQITNDYVTVPEDCAEKEFTLYVDAPLTVVCDQYPEAMNGERIAFLDNQVTVSVERKATDYDVFYTTDGNDPNPGSSNTTQIAKGTKKVYQQLTITEDCTLKARAFENDGSGNYTAKSEIYSMIFEKLDKIDAGREPEVKASRESGTFAETFNLSLEAYKPDKSVRGDVKIYYTTDGNAPDVTLNIASGFVELGENTMEYNSPITIEHNSEDEIDEVVVKAVAVLFSKTGYKIAVSSAVKELTFTEVNGVTVSGTVTSFNNDTDEVTIQLIPQGYSEAAYEKKVTGKSAEYSIEGVAPGTYTMKVIKKNHVTRTYTVVVGAEDVGQDVEIYLLGDVNLDGKVNIKDVTRLRQYIKSPSTYVLSDEAQKTANVNGDALVNIKDVTRLRQHIKTPGAYPLI